MRNLLRFLNTYNLLHYNVILTFFVIQNCTSVSSFQEKIAHLCGVLLSIFLLLLLLLLLVLLLYLVILRFTVLGKCSSIGSTGKLIVTVQSILLVIIRRNSFVMAVLFPAMFLNFQLSDTIQQKSFVKIFVKLIFQKILRSDKHITKNCTGAGIFLPWTLAASFYH